MKTTWLAGAGLLLLAACGSSSHCAQTPPASAYTQAHAPKPYITLEEARIKAHEHAAKLDRMTPAQWAAMKKPPKYASLTLEQARKEARHHARHLDHMTDAQWQAKHPAPTPAPVVQQ